MLSHSFHLVAGVLFSVAHTGPLDVQWAWEVGPVLLVPLCRGGEEAVSVRF